MSLESVRRFFAERAPHIAIIELDTSTATVELAARAHGVEPGRIDNARFKARFGKGKMLGAEEVEGVTGHPVGGVCPFGLATPLPVYLDASLAAFDEVLPAAGAVHSAVRVSPVLLAELTGGEWVDVCRMASEEPAA